jgi:nitroreductase
MRAALPPTPEFGQPLPVTATPQVLDFLSRRRSVSAVTLGSPAPNPDQLRDLLRLATRTPDHGKLSPWRFILLEGQAKAEFADRLDALAKGRGDSTSAAKLAKLKIPPLALVVVSSPKPGAIPEWEQVLSAGAVCTLLLESALAMGFGANWITDWYSYDVEALKILGLAEGERVAGFVLIGTPQEPPLERERPDPAALVTAWTPDASSKA